MQRLIFGYGYLGSRVGERWKNRGQTVHAVTRKADRMPGLRASGVLPLQADVTRPETLGELPEADTVLVAVGMDRSTYSDIRTVYVDGLTNVLEALPDSIGHLIYVSSTGVYGDFAGAWVDEDSPTEPTRDGGKACLEAEQRIRESRFGSRATILRFAGIYGPHRVPTRSTIAEGRWSRLHAQGYLNLIQVDDGARLIEQIADSRPTGETYLVSDGHPVLRQDYYEEVAGLLGVQQIPWDESAGDSGSARSSSSKRISNAKLKSRFEFEFQFPDYRSGLRNAIGDSPRSDGPS